MLRPSAPPRRNTWTNTLAPASAAEAILTRSGEALAATPSAVSPPLFRKTRRDSSQAMASSPHLEFGARQEEPEAARGHARRRRAGVHLRDRVHGLVGERGPDDGPTHDRRQRPRVAQVGAV